MVTNVLPPFLWFTVYIELHDIVAALLASLFSDHLANITKDKHSMQKLFPIRYSTQKYFSNFH